MEGFMDKCRLCLEDGIGGESIFAQGTEKNYLEIIFNCFQIKLDELDMWPSKACGGCVRALDTIVDLKRKIYSAQEHLGRIALKAQMVKLEDQRHTAEEADEVNDTSPNLFTWEELPESQKTVKKEVVDKKPAENDDQKNLTDNPERSRRQSARNQHKKVPLPSLEELQLQKIKKAEDAKAKQARAEVCKQVREEEKILASMMTEMNLLNCKECLVEFETLPLLQQHAQAVHKMTNCFVVCCGRNIYKQKVKDHMRYHRDKTQFACKVCGAQFLFRQSLHSHERTAHGLKCKLVCEQCGKKFNAKSMLDIHLIKHVPKEERDLKFACTECDKKFPLANHLDQHMRDHHSDSGSFMCEICGKEHTNKARLKMHMNTHNEKVKKKCDVCQRYYMNVKTHKRRNHTNPVRVPCEVCGKQVIKETLKSHHKNFHSDQKFTCSICQKEFKLRITYTVHMKMHLGIKSPCYFCPFGATDPANRVKHMRASHAEEFENYLANKGKTPD